MATSANFGSTGENIQHVSHIRLRVIGSGVLRHTLYSLDDIRSTSVPNLTMQSATNREPTKLANFVEQRVSLEGKTTDINEYLRINRIIIFFKEYGSEYPM